MTNKTLTFEGDSLDEVRRAAQEALPPGIGIVAEHVVSDGVPSTLTRSGETVEAAFQAALSLKPQKAVLVKKRKVEPGVSTISVDAYDQETAWRELAERFPKDAMIGLPILKVKGSKGILGFGKKPHTYEADVRTPAIVSIIVKTRAEIRVDIRDKEEIKREREQERKMIDESFPPGQKDAIIKILLSLSPVDPAQRKGVWGPMMQRIEICDSVEDVIKIIADRGKLKFFNDWSLLQNPLFEVN